MACASHSSIGKCAALLAPSNPLVGGLYSVWLRELLRALPSAQLRVLRTEDVGRDPAETAREALAFLRLPHESAVESALRQGSWPREPTSTGTAGVEQQQQRLVREFYEEDAHELVQMMDGEARFGCGSC